MNVIYEKSFHFAIRVVKLYRFMTDSKKEFVLSKQLLRSGTSIGANIARKTQFKNQVIERRKKVPHTLLWDVPSRVS